MKHPLSTIGVLAINVEEIAQAFYFGLRQQATSSIPPVFKKYFPKDLQGYPYNPEKAKQLLDESVKIKMESLLK